MTKINRKELVGRHHPRFNEINKLSPLSVGNGKFAFTADVTGLQTFPETYEVPLGTQSEWGWHYTNGPEHYDLNDVTMQKLTTYNREVDYPRHPEDNPEAYHWLRQNPHRVQLGQISFKLLKENRSEEHTSELQSRGHLVCRLLYPLIFILFPYTTLFRSGWHYTNGPEHYDLNDVTMQKLTTYNREVDYPRHPEDNPEAYHWLRQNPHRVQLGQISFKLLKEN